VPNFKIFQETPDKARVKIYGSQDVAIRTDSTGAVVITSPSLSVETTVATTDVSAVIPDITDTDGSPDETRLTLGLRTWTLGVLNGPDSEGEASVKLQLSPDADNWMDEAAAVTLDVGDVASLVATTFLKYARVYYAAVNAASAITLSIFFQGQS
jgi:hypothetical protein